MSTPGMRELIAKWRRDAEKCHALISWAPKGGHECDGMRECADELESELKKMEEAVPGEQRGWLIEKMIEGYGPQWLGNANGIWTWLQDSEEMLVTLAVAFGCQSGGDPRHAMGVCAPCINAEIAATVALAHTRAAVKAAREELGKIMAEHCREAVNLQVGAFRNVILGAIRDTPFRCHAEDDRDFHSGCVQTKEAILDAVRSLDSAAASQALAEHDAKVANAARLEEAKWFKENCTSTFCEFTCICGERIAALEGERDKGTK